VKKQVGTRNYFKQTPQMKSDSLSSDSDKKTSDSENNNTKKGSLDYDVPFKIVTAKIKQDTNEVQCEIEWKKRYDGTKPDNSFLNNKELRIKCPTLLLDYYESKVQPIRSKK
jgi:hypothetical protein